MRIIWVRKTVKPIVKLCLWVLGLNQIGLATPYFVLDMQNLAQTTASAATSAQTAINTATQIQNQITSLQYQLKNLSTLTDKSTFDSASANLSAQLSQLTSLLNGVKGIGYQMNSINQDFSTLFPTNSAWASKSMDDYSHYLNSWSNEIQSASTTAMQSQTVINNIQSNNQQIQAILTQAKGDNNGEVAELQSVNQLLGVMENQLGDLTSTLATSSRLAATATAENQASADESRQIMQDFTDSPVLPTTDGHAYGPGDF